MAMAVLSRAHADFSSSMDVFHDEVNLEQVFRLQRQIQSRRRSKSTVYLSGVGKSMNMAGHIADMLKSIGIKAVCIDPTKAMHGDSGMIGDTDLLLAFSKSGGTKEVVRLVQNLQARESGCTTFACVCNPNCDLTRFCDDKVVLPVHAEVDPGWNLVPTVSSAYFLSMGNLLVASILDDEEYDLVEYGKSHPGGNIGAASRNMLEKKAATRTFSNWNGEIAHRDTRPARTPARGDGDSPAFPTPQRAVQFLE